MGKLLGRAVPARRSGTANTLTARGDSAPYLSSGFWMGIWSCLLFCSLLSPARAASPDSIVTFNEIMYHPLTNEQALEWIELYNQMSYDMDLSQWSLDGAIHFTFPEGTLIRGRGFLVVALDPATLATNSGFNAALGPFTGRLSNDGEQLELRNNNRRLMDQVWYGTDNDWPAGADGAGPSLAKRGPTALSGDAENWTTSREMGGTPGRTNFSTNNSVALATLAFNEISAATNAPFQVEIINFGGEPVPLAGYLIRGAAGVYTFLYQELAPGAFISLAGPELGFTPATDSKLFLYAPGQSALLDAVSVKSAARGRHPDGTGRWLFPQQATPGASNYFVFHHELVINEIMYHHRPIPATPAVYGPANQLFSMTNEWRYYAQGDEPGADWRAPGYADGAWPTGAALLYHSPSAFSVPKNTALPVTNAAGQRINTYYFRTPFVLANPVQEASLSLRQIVDDGAIYYLNGIEIYRYNMPEGPATYRTVASVGISIATVTGPFSLPVTNLVVGTNALAVEVHRISTVDNDAVFAAELQARVQLVPETPLRESPESWIELYNRGSNTVDLTGWRLDEGIDYRFAAGKTIPPGGYLVVAKDVDYLRSLYPQIDVVGPFTNKLSKTTDLIALKDANNNPANEVRFFDGGYWPEAADGAGASLELRDPWADNSKPEAWVASDEGAKSPWVWYTNRAVAVSSPQPPTTYNELVLGLLDAGECLIDDLRLVESPTNNPVSLLQNGDFAAGLKSWRVIGNHYGSATPDPDNSANPVLRLLASGATEYLHNHAETTLKNGSTYYTIVNGRQYELSFRARWLAGNNLLNARLWMNRTPRTFELAVPPLNGTPGARNSRCEPNIGPTFSDFRHASAVPLASAPVTVSVAAGDPQGVASCTLFWSVNGGAWRNAAMSSTPQSATRGQFTGVIPGAAAGAVVQFYVQAKDGLGAASTCPPAGPKSRALYQVGDGRAQLNLAHNLRIIMVPSDTDLLFQATNLMSNGRLGATVIWDETEVYYDAGVRPKGSEHGRADSQRIGFMVDFRADQLFRGIHSSIGVDRSGGWRFGSTFGQDEILVKHIINRAGGLPGMYDDLIRVITPRNEHTGPAILQLARYGDVFLNSHFQDGGDGTAFEYELLYDLSATTGGPEGFKVPQESGVAGVTLSDLGDDQENYRLNFIIKNNRDQDDYSHLMAALKAIGQPAGASFDAATARTLDVDEWLRAYAVSALVNPGDNYGGDGAQHNLMLYTRPADQKTLFFIWDTDFAFFGGATEPIVENSELQKFVANPANRRRYYEHLLDILTTTYNTSYMAYWTDHYDNFLPGQNFSSILSYIGQRANFALGQLPRNTPFAVTNNTGKNFGTSTNYLLLGGTAPLTVRSIEINGIDYPITWTSTTNWTLTIPLNGGANALAVQGFDAYGRLLTNVADTIVVTNHSAPALLPVVINEFMADNAGPGGLADPADGAYQDWFELFNPNSVAVNLAGFSLTDNLSQPAKWRIPEGTILAPQGFRLVWADNQTNQNSLAPDSDLHAAFQLNNGGEAIGLFAPNGALQASVTFGPQSENISQGLYPDGNLSGDLRSLTNYTPRLPNSLAGRLRVIAITIQGSAVTIQWQAAINRLYRVEYKEDLAAPTWTPLAPAIQATAATASATDNPSGARQRFYRVVLAE